MPETVFGCGISVDSPTPDGGAIRAGRGSEMQSTTRQRALRVFGVAAITVSMISYAPGVSAAGSGGNSPQVTPRYQDTSSTSTGTDGGDGTSGGATGGNGGDGATGGDGASGTGGDANANGGDATGGDATGGEAIGGDGGEASGDTTGGDTVGGDSHWWRR